MYLDCPSRQECCYALVLTDVATQMFREYLLKTRSGGEFTFIRNWVDGTLKTYAGNDILRHYHADGRGTDKPAY